MDSAVPQQGRTFPRRAGFTWHRGTPLADPGAARRGHGSPGGPGAATRRKDRPRAGVTCGEDRAPAGPDGPPASRNAPGGPGAARRGHGSPGRPKAATMCKDRPGRGKEFIPTIPLALLRITHVLTSAVNLIFTYLAR